MTPEDLAVLTEVGKREGYDPNYWSAFSAEWEKWENTSAAFNPLASTDSSVPGAIFNSDGVRGYTNFEDGVNATIRTLNPGSYYKEYIDWYRTVRLAIKLQSIDGAGRSLVEAEIRKWGTAGFANVIATGWNPTVVVAPLPKPTPLTFEELNTALQKRFAISRLADDPELWKVEKAWQLLKEAGLL